MEFPSIEFVVLAALGVALVVFFVYQKRGTPTGTPSEAEKAIAALRDALADAIARLHQSAPVTPRPAPPAAPPVPAPEEKPAPPGTPPENAPQAPPAPAGGVTPIPAPPGPVAGQETPAPAVPAPPAPPPAPPATGLLDAYIDRDDFMKRLGAGYPYAVTLDGRPVHEGFGPADAFWTQPNGSIARAKPAGGEVDVPIETG